jgi:hypothetical protein
MPELASANGGGKRWHGQLPPARFLDGFFLNFSEFFSRDKESKGKGNGGVLHISF